MFRLIPSSLFLLTLSCAVASAQRVYWEPNAGSLAYDQASPLQLVFENCEPEGDPKLPAVDGLEFLFTGSASSFAMENMHVTRKHLFNFDARPTRRPEVRIPAFDVETDKGVKHVAAATFAVGNATVGQTAIPLETAALGGLTPADGAFWAGEVFPVTYTLNVAQRFNPRAQGSVMWKPAPLTVEDWSQPEHFSATTGGEPRVGLIYKSRGYINTPGNYRIPAATQEIVLVINTSGNLLFPFSAPDMVKHTVTSNEPSLTIKPLPDGAPADFGGAVGQFTLKSKVVPTSVAVGEPVTWTLSLSGTGNWPDVRGLPEREVSRDFKVLQPQAKRTPSEGKLFDAVLSEDVVLIPTKPGTYTLGPVIYSYFDPHAGTYRTVQTDRATITITPPGSTGPNNQALFTPPSSIGSAPAVPTTGAYTPHLAAPPTAPAEIPRDPLVGTDTGQVPLGASSWSLWLLASVLWLIPAWLIMAARRSRRTDPLLERREARERLGRILAGMPGVSTPLARAQALHAWQRQTAMLLDIAHAAPSAAILSRRSHDPDGKTMGDANGNHWEILWAEADRALYGNRNPLPDDWVVRAEAALEATRVPGWQSSSLFQPRNLLPWFGGNGNGVRKRHDDQVIAAVIVLFCLFFFGPRALGETATDSPAAATAAKPSNYFASPRDAYDTGDFPAAEQGWRASIAHDPTDWVARHNLGLALAQQGHWPEAAAQWTSAFLLNPRDESVRWHLGLGYERADYTPPGLGEFAVASGPHLLARLASPAEWQWLLVGAGLVLAGGLLILLLRAYHSVSGRWARPAALAAMATALVVALSAVMSLHFYGETVDPRAAIAWHQVLLRSIPTEADTQQKTSSLPAGSLGIVDKEFLGWVRLAFDNGQTGWVRQQDIVWLYR
jgi:tetratricopeptide (TPR) repeat protein